MLKINDSSYIKLIKMKKYKDLYDFSSLECRIALVTMFIFDITFIICSFNIGLNNITNEFIKILDNIGISLIGFLGFIVTGLAILTGAISSKIVKRLKDRNKMEVLERILLSFYLIGLISAFITILSFILHFITILSINSIFLINIILLSLISYLVTFIIFYSVKLIGNCLELFYIINSMQLIDDRTINYKEIYNNYRITALEKIELKTTSIDKVNEYKNSIEDLIRKDILSYEEKKILLDMHNKHFS